MVNFLDFRMRAIASLSILNGTKNEVKFLSSEDKEKWVKSEYDRHYPSGGKYGKFL